MKIPAELPIEATIGLIDTREELAYALAPMGSERASLATGDYSVRGLESVVALERKSLPDLISCIGTERARFERELMRLLAFPVRGVIVEASWADLETGDWRSRITPAAATGSVLGWMASGIPFLLCGSREAAQAATVRLLYGAARRRWRELRTLHQSILETTT